MFRFVGTCWNGVKRGTRFIVDKAVDKAKETAAVITGGAATAFAASQAQAGLPAIPDVGIEVGDYAESAGLVLGGTLGQIIAVAFGFMVVFVGVIWFKKFVK